MTEEGNLMNHETKLFITAMGCAAGSGFAFTTGGVVGNVCGAILVTCTAINLLGLYRSLLD